MNVARADVKLRIEVAAHSTPTPGLVLHPTIGQAAWTVTHLSSGRSLGWCFPSALQARTFAVRLGRTTDWTRSMDALGAETGLGERVGALAEEEGGRPVGPVPLDAPAG